MAWVAERQLGLGTTEQLEAAGIGRGAIAVRAAGLPVPLINHPVIGFNADIYRPEVGLIVEVDGGDFHRPRPAFERDHRRDIVHTDGGHEVLRVSGQQIDREPIYIAAVIVRAYERLNRGRG